MLGFALWRSSDRHPCGQRENAVVAYVAVDAPKDAFPFLRRDSDGNAAPRFPSSLKGRPKTRGGFALAALASRFQGGRSLSLRKRQLPATGKPRGDIATPDDANRTAASFPVTAPKKGRRAREPRRWGSQLSLVASLMGSARRGGTAFRETLRMHARTPRRYSR